MRHFFEAAPGGETSCTKGGARPLPGTWRQKLRRYASRCSKLARPLLAAGTMLALATAADAATFTLRDGTRVEGEIVHVTRNTLMLRLMPGGGLKQLSRHELQSVTIVTDAEGTVEGSLESWKDGVYEIQADGRLLKLRNQQVVAESDIKPPLLTISDAKGSEGDSDLVFDITLSRPSKQQILVIYATLDRSAKAGKDFEESRGSIIIRPGETSAKITVPLINDDLAEDDKHFEVFVATDQKVATIESKRATGTILNDDKEAALSGDSHESEDQGDKQQVQSGEEISLKNTE